MAGDLLAHAFEDLGASRVGLKTDFFNERSQRAIERIGALREGVMRADLRGPPPGKAIPKGARRSYERAGVQEDLEPAVVAKSNLR